MKKRVELLRSESFHSLSEGLGSLNMYAGRFRPICAPSGEFGVACATSNNPAFVWSSTDALTARNFAIARLVTCGFDAHIAEAAFDPKQLLPDVICTLKIAGTKQAPFDTVLSILFERNAVTLSLGRFLTVRRTVSDVDSHHGLRLADFLDFYGRTVRAAEIAASVDDLPHAINAFLFSVDSVSAERHLFESVAIPMEDSERSAYWASHRSIYSATTLTTRRPWWSRELSCDPDAPNPFEQCFDSRPDPVEDNFRALMSVPGEDATAGHARVDHIEIKRAKLTAEALELSRMGLCSATNFAIDASVAKGNFAIYADLLSPEYDDVSSAHTRSRDATISAMKALGYRITSCRERFDPYDDGFSVRCEGPAGGDIAIGRYGIDFTIYEERGNLYVADVPLSYEDFPGGRDEALGLAVKVAEECAEEGISEDALARFVPQEKWPQDLVWNDR